MRYQWGGEGRNYLQRFPIFGVARIAANLNEPQIILSKLQRLRVQLQFSHFIALLSVATAITPNAQKLIVVVSAATALFTTV